MEELSWKEVLSIVDIARHSSQKCTVRVLDTVFMDFNNDMLDISWYFTTKNGTISKKKKDKCSIEAVSDRFCRFSLANPNNAEAIVGVIVHEGSGKRQFLDQAAIHMFLSSSYKSLQSDDWFLQVYLRPYAGNAHVVRASCIVDATGRNAITVSIQPTMDSNGSISNTELELSLDAKDQAKYFCHELCNFFSNDSSDFKLREFEIDCILDDNKHLWLSRIKRCSVQVKNESREQPATISVLPELAKQTSRANLSSKNSIRSISPRAGSAERARADPPQPTASAAGLPSQLLGRIEGGAAHSCTKGPEDLPGLRAWILDSMSQDKQRPGSSAAKTTMTWFVDIAAYNGGSSPNPNSADIYHQRASVRKTVPHSILSLLRLAEPLLLGLEDVKTDSEFVGKWKTVFDAWLSSQRLINEGAANSDIDDNMLSKILKNSTQVTVDGNCHAVCQKLESLVDSRFAVSTPRATQELGNTSGSRGSSAGIAERAVRTDGAAAAMREGNKEVIDRRTVSSAGHGDISAPPLEPFEAQWGNYDNVSLVSSIGEDSVQHLVSKNRTKDGAPLYATYQDESNRMVDMRNGKQKPTVPSNQKKKKKTSIKQPPPTQQVKGGADMEMLAKFAAAKEMERRRLMELEESAKGMHEEDIPNRAPFNGNEDRDQSLPRTQDPHGSDAAYLRNQKRKKEFQKQPTAMTKTKKATIDKPRRDQYHDGYQYEDDTGDIYPPDFHQLHDASVASYSGVVAPSPQRSIADNVSLTGSEAHFMMRHAQAGDFSHIQDSQSIVTDMGSSSHRNGHTDGQYPSSANAGAVEIGQLGDKLASSMRQRVTALEEQVRNLASRLEKKDIELDRAEDRSRKLQNEKNALSNYNIKEISRIKEEHERELLKMKSDYAVKLSNLVNDPRALEAAEKELSSAKLEDREFAQTSKSSTARQESTIQATSALIQQLDDMRGQMRRQAETFASERRQLTADHSLKLINTERSFKIELQEQRALTAALEDKLKDTEDALIEVRSQERTSRMMYAQLEGKYKDSVEVQTKLKNDVKIMQASVSNTYKLESAQEIGVGVDADTAIRLAEAKSEAKIRQIQIKCDFMRSQLEAEHAAQEQLNQTIEQKRKEYDELKNDFRTRVREMETEKEQAVEDAERRTELHFEERMLELSALQSKFHMIQGQLQEAFQDNAMSRQREESAKANALKAQAQQANLRAELNNTKSMIEELRVQKEEGSVKESANQSNEAMLRRLDNERTYLKSQLSSEMTHKNELQSALRQCQQHMSEQQRQWTADVDSLKATLTQKEEDATLQEQKMALRISALEGEDARLKAQNSELRDGFKKMRDQLRVEEMNIENTRTANRRLLEEVEASRAELARLKHAEEAANTMSQQQASLMTGSLSALEEKAAAEAAHLRSELSKQYVANAESQRALLDMKGEFELERVQLDKKLSAGRIVHSMRHMYTNRMAATFHAWHLQSTLVDAATQFKETLKKALARTQEEDRKDSDEALSQLRDQLSSEWKNRMDDATQDHQERLNEALAEADSQRVASLEDLREEMEAVLRAREREWESRHENAEEWTRNQLDDEAKKQEELTQYYERKAADESARRDTQEAEKIASTRAFALAEAEQQWNEVRQQRDLEFQVHMENSIRVVEEGHLVKIKNIRAELAREKATALGEQQAQFAEQLAGVRQQHQEDKQTMQEVHTDEIHDLLGAAQVKHDDAMEDLKTEMLEAQEQRVRELRVLWEEELQSKMDKHDAEMTRQFNEKAEKIDNSVEAERKKAEALEAAKWRQALKDAEKRYKLDLQQVRAQAWSERDQEAKLELASLAADNNRSIQSLKDKQAEVLAGMKMSMESELESLSCRLEVEKEEAIRLAILNTANALNEKWEKEFATKIAEADKKAQQQWAMKYNKEKELTEKLRGDMAKRNQAQAEERSTLQDKINGNDEIIGRLEADHKFEVQRMERDHERAMDNMDIRFQNAKKIWKEEEKKREEEDMANAKAGWEAETRQKVQKVKTDMETEMELEMQKVKEESDQLVTGLETAMMNIRHEKTALVEDLERASERLEELEDAQFDLQQELKLKAKEMSFALWKISAGAMNMKIAFKNVMDDSQSKMTSLLESTKTSMIDRIEKLTLLSMRLSALLGESEMTRKSMYEAITQHKSNILVERRAQIRMTELELDRLGTDREVMDDERNSLLDEIGGQGGLESQVEEVENQMREHTNSSTVMQNGRINVAHAKKKKRLDNELERLLELIEQKKSQAMALEQRADAVQTRREEKEVILIDLERELVQILIEQQRKVLSLVEDGKMTEDKAKHVATQYNFPWPPIEHPTTENAKELIAAIRDM